MTETLASAPAAPVWDVWDGELRCALVEEVTHDVKTFVLEPPEPRVFGFDPGQYVTVTATVDGQQVSRCYSISSPSTRPGRLAITVKRVPGGVMSNWLHDHLAVGDTLRVEGPLGRFSMTEHPAAKYLFLSGGSGITPLMSMARTMRDVGAPTDTVFVHNARTPVDIVFRHELQELATDSAVRVVPICEGDSAEETWTGLRGRLTLPMLQLVAPDLRERTIMACGPAPYLAAVRDILAEAGLDPGRYHEESFDLDDQAGEASRNSEGEDGASARVFTVEFSRSGRTIECDADTYVLDAALRAGLSVPSSCGMGMCGTCKTTLTDGTVDMQPAGGIRPREIAQNKVLICCSRPTGDLVIDA